MKLNCWFIIATFLSTTLLAQQNTNPPAQTPAAAPPATNAAAHPSPPRTNPPAATSEKKKATKTAKKTTAKKKAPGAELRSVPLVAGPATVIASNVNIRGQAKLKSEIVGRLNKGQSVTVLEEITLKNSAVDEPSAWAKILLPTNSHVWVNTMFIESANATNKTVKPRKLNLRSGPGENYSVLGTLKRGDAVKEISTKEDWTEIEAPVDAYAFVAAQYLSQETAPVVAATKPAEPVETPATVAEAPQIAAPPTETPARPVPPITPAPSNDVPTTLTTTTPTEPVPPPRRIVQHEGILRGTFSIQAPTHFELANPENGRTVNFLYTTSPDLDLRRYKGLRIVVTGEEGLDERWKNTPILTIEKIQVVE